MHPDPSRSAGRSGRHRVYCTGPLHRHVLAGDIGNAGRAHHLCRKRCRRHPGRGRRPCRAQGDLSGQPGLLRYHHHRCECPGCVAAEHRQHHPHQRLDHREPGPGNADQGYPRDAAEELLRHWQHENGRPGTGRRNRWNLRSGLHQRQRPGRRAVQRRRHPARLGRFDRTKLHDHRQWRPPDVRTRYLHERHRHGISDRVKYDHRKRGDGGEGRGVGHHPVQHPRPDG